MFKIKKKYKLKKPILFPIVSSLEVLHFDQFPILYTGRNRRKQNVVGLHINEQDDVFRFIKCIPHRHQCKKWRSGGMTYRELLFSFEWVYIVDKDINGNIESAWHLPLAEVPTDFLPTEGLDIFGL